MFFYIVLTSISTTSSLYGTGHTRKYHLIDVYIYQRELPLLSVLAMLSVSYYSIQIPFVDKTNVSRSL